VYFFLLVRIPALNLTVSCAWGIRGLAYLWGGVQQNCSTLLGVSDTPAVSRTGLWGFAATRLIQGNDYMNTESTFFVKRFWSLPDDFCPDFQFSLSHPVVFQSFD